MAQAQPHATASVAAAAGKVLRPAVQERSVQRIARIKRRLRKEVALPQAEAVHPIEQLRRAHHRLELAAEEGAAGPGRLLEAREQLRKRQPAAAAAAAAAVAVVRSNSWSCSKVERGPRPSAA